MNTLKYTSNILLVLLFVTITGYAKEWERVENLRGYWKFTIGDDKSWADPDYDDGSWEEIKVPSPWESEGFHGYNGYAWYRKSFDISGRYDRYSLLLVLGYIDDVDEVYLNGKQIGASGSFPPGYESAYNALRKYYIPEGLLNYDKKNVIAVRVYDSQLNGGITSGDIGIYAYSKGMKLDIMLEGAWKFKTGDNPEYKEKNYDDANWDKIYVPGFWENSGYKDYNGFGWYRIHFKFPVEYKNQKMILVLGKIDDVDESFINGKLVGSTGVLYDDPDKIEFDMEYDQFRGYYIPDGVLKPGEENVIAVRVFDNYINGGIYEGPVGLITQKEYRDYWRDRKEKKNIWEILFGD